MDGLLVIDKPSGPTSHDVVARLRRLTGERRIGHTGTLDPLASGVLPVVVGRATRLARFLSAGDKVYEAVVRLGMATDTYDSEGAPAESSRGLPDGVTISRAEIERALDPFRGTFLQTPPRYSAKKIGGRRSYEIAREAIRLKPDPTSELDPTSTPDATPDSPAPVAVTAHAIEIIDWNGVDVTLRVHCSSGFYVRSLAHDLGERLGVGGHLTALRRTEAAGLTLLRAVGLDALERDPSLAGPAVIPMGQMLSNLPALVLTADDVQRVGHGQDVGVAIGAGSPAGSTRAPGPVVYVRLLAPDGDLLAIAEPSAGRPGFLHPSVVLR